MKEIVHVKVYSDGRAEVLREIVLDKFIYDENTGMSAETTCRPSMRCFTSLDGGHII